MNTLAHAELTGMLDRLKLTAIRDQLDTLLDEAARSEMTLREALGFLVSREIARRDERRIKKTGRLSSSRKQSTTRWTRPRRRASRP